MHRVVAKLADGSYAGYVYEVRGGPLVRKVYGRTKADCWDAIKAPDDRRSVHGAVLAYLDSDHFKGRSASTQDAYQRYLKRFVEMFGDVSLSAFSDYRIRTALTDFRNEYADTPRGADYMMRSISAFFRWARETGLTDAEPIRQMGTLHKANRSDLIWTQRDFHTIRAHATPALYRAIRLAGETGLRQGDLVALRWNQIGRDTIQLITGKTKGVAVIPLTRPAKLILSKIGRRDGLVLLGQRGTPWTTDGIKTEFQKAKTAAGLKLRFHDLRGTAATRFRAAGFTNEEVARAMGWKVAAVEELMVRYVRNADVMRAAIDRVNTRRRR